MERNQDTRRSILIIVLVCLVLVVALLFLGLVIGFAVITNATIWLKAVFILFAILLLGLSLRLMVRGLKIRVPQTKQPIFEGILVRKSHLMEKGMPELRFGTVGVQMLWLVRDVNSGQTLPVHVILSQGGVTPPSGEPFVAVPELAEQFQPGDRISIENYEKQNLIFRKNDDLLDMIRDSNARVTPKGRFVTVEPAYLVRDHDVRRHEEGATDV